MRNETAGDANDLFDIFSNAISSIFSSKHKLSTGKRLEYNSKVRKQTDAKSETRDSLFLFPLGKYVPHHLL